MVLVTHLEEDVAMAGWFDSSGEVGSNDQVDWASLFEAGDITNGLHVQLVSVSCSMQSALITDHQSRNTCCIKLMWLF